MNEIWEAKIYYMNQREEVRKAKYLEKIFKKNLINTVKESPTSYDIFTKELFVKLDTSAEEMLKKKVIKELIPEELHSKLSPEVEIVSEDCGNTLTFNTEDFQFAIFIPNRRALNLDNFEWEGHEGTFVVLAGIGAAAICETYNENEVKKIFSLHLEDDVSISLH